MILSTFSIGTEIDISIPEKLILLIKNMEDKKMNLVRWNNHPFFSDLFENLLPKIYNKELCDECIPAANIIENKDSFELEIAAPGMNKKDFKINLDNNILTILSERESKKEEKSEKNEDNVSYTRREFIYSSFNRSFTLPKSIELDKIKADYKNGILNISLPKKDEEKLNVKKEILVS